MSQIVLENCVAPPEGRFEGPEKRLEIDFRPISSSAALGRGLRNISREEWGEMLTFAKCTILSHMDGEHCDAFVLSESSLFVYPRKVMIKTCGTTTLLNCIDKLLEFANRMDLEVEFVMFSRKNLLFPGDQRFPHTAWKDEVDYLNSYFDGTPYILGPLNAEHWYLYLADYSVDTRLTQPEQTLEIMMHNLDTSVLHKFYRKEELPENEKLPGVAELLPGSDTDEFNFTPCGYSMNGVLGEAYYTIHVTPEAHCSYASFETNVSLPSYRTLISQVIALFKPHTLTITFFAEHGAKCKLPPQNTPDLEIEGFTMRHKTFSELEGNCDITMCNYESFERARHQKPRKVPMARASYI